jgi:medium-chain acyl-[acyl-carrier-protein] hydrolase
MHTTPWLQRKTVGTPRARLFCFPYAGGSSTVYAQWQAGLDPAIEVCAVQLPGRGVRLVEAPCWSMPDLIGALLGALRGNDDLPFAFFGHSLGALIAFELARHCQWHGLPTPAHLIVSGSSAPQARAASRNLHAMDDALLFKELEVYNGTPPEVLQNRELMSMVLPSIRADFALAEQYVYRNGPLLDMPLTAFAGKSDPHVSPGQVAGWQKETVGRFQEQWFEGDHFFLAPRQKDILEYVGNLLREAHA